MTVPTRHPFDTDLAQEAAEWFIVLQGNQASREQQQAFAEWLRRSPVHIEEFLQLTALHGDLGRLLEYENLDVEQLLLKLDLRSSDTLVSLPVRRAMDDVDVRSLSKTQPPSRRTRHVRLGRVVGIAIVLIAAGTWTFGGLAKILATDRYRTQVGEQLAVTLADGSQVELNAASKLTATVNSSLRELQLDDGEALFRVAKDRVHPFRVHTPQATIEAKGTQFNVDVGSDATVVSLLEGQVLVTTSTSSILLTPGEQVSIPAHGSYPLTAHAVDMKAVIAWTQHRLVFDDVPLSLVVAQFNRYSPQPFIVMDPTLRDLRITGTFDISSTQSFGDSLAAVGMLRVTRQEPSGAYLIERK